MKHAYSFRLIALFFFASLAAMGQIDYSANTPGKVKPYTGIYNYGSNVGYYDQTWDDKSLGDIAAGNPKYNVPGVGVKSFRAFLNERFLASKDPALGADAYGWGYDIRVPEFRHYDSLGMKDQVVFLAVNVLNSDRKDYIRPDHVDNTIYPGCNEKSLIFKNIYEPIWDGGANGTAVNENNYFALFIYNTVKTYKPFTKFWEIGNEPDYTGSVGSFALPGQNGNWWDNPPAACDLTNLKAPVYSYIRMMRIAYEVIKFTDPEAYVCTGGIGYPSFLDAVCRFTDNPDGGKVTNDYPLKGGAFFDVLSFHEYPQYALSKDVNGTRVYFRHSDAAAEVVTNKKNAFQAVLSKYGYNGNPYPEKNWILTEVNIPRKQFAGSNDIGGDEVQRNFIAKCLVVAQKQNIKQVHIFNLGEVGDPATVQYPGNEVMGLYYDLLNKGPLVKDPTTGGYKNSGNYRQQPNQAGIAYKTVSDALFGYSYDAARTTALNLPATIEGGAFQNGDGKYVYVLWAKTNIDQSETASATFSFPAGVNVSANLERKEWNYSQTKTTAVVSSQNIQLGGSPVFLTVSGGVADTQAPTAPTALTATNVTNNSFTLNWTASTDNVGVTGYDVYKDGVLFASVTGLTVNITGLSTNRTYAMTVKAKDGAGNVSLPSAALNVATTNTCPTITLSPATLADGKTGQPYTTQLTTNGGIAPYTLTRILPGLPPGLDYVNAGGSAVGNITGTPTRAGTYTFTIVISDANGCQVSQQFTMLISPVCPNIVIADTPTVQATVGEPVQVGLSVSGGTAPYFYQADNLPPGLSISTSGVITGRPTQSGQVVTTINVTDYNGCTSSKALTFQILRVPGNLPNGIVGINYYYGLNTGAVQRMYSLVGGSLPEGVYLDGRYGIIFGKAVASGSYTFTLTGTTDQGEQTTQSYILNVECPLLSITTASLSGAVVFENYLEVLAATGGTGSFLYSLTSGALPDGVYLDGRYGVIFGRSTKTGTFAFTITATDGYGCKVSKSFSISINCPGMSISGTPPDSPVGFPYFYTLSSSGNIGTALYSLSAGSLPKGVYLDGRYGDIFGRVLQTGTYAFTVTATDERGCQTSKDFAINVNCPTLAITTTSLPDAALQTDYFQVLNTSGGSGSYQYAFAGGTLPDGINLDGRYGHIFGKPVKAGTFVFTVTATDGYGCQTTLSLTINVPASPGRQAAVSVKGVAGEAEQTVNLYPNPAAEVIVLSLVRQERVQVQLFDVMGRQVYNQAHEPGSDLKTTCNISKLASGTYFVKIIAPTQTHVLKLVKN